jgi:hypothetical protein
MPIWLYLILTPLCSFVGYFGGDNLGAFARMFTISALHGLGVEGVAVNFLLGVPLFFGGALVGLGLCTAFAVYYIPGRCPQCGGRTYYRPGRPTTYRCGSCGHVHATRAYQR